MLKIALLLLVASRAWGAWPIVAAAGAGCNSGNCGGGAVTGTATVATQDCTNANVIIINAEVFGSSNDASIFGGKTTVQYTTNGGTTWVSIANGSTNEGFNNAQMAQWWTDGITGTSTTAWRATNNSGGSPRIDGVCVQGMVTPAPLDTTSTVGTGSTSCQSGSLTPGVSNAFLFASLSTDASTGTITIDSNYSITSSNILVGGTSQGGGVASIFQAAASATQPTWSISGGASADAVCVLQSFKSTAPPAGSRRRMTAIQ